MSSVMETSYIYKLPLCYLIVLLVYLDSDFLRYQDLLDVVQDGFSTHDDGELSCQLHQTTARITLQDNKTQSKSQK